MGKCQKYFEKLGIEHYLTSDSLSKVALVERSNKEIRSLIHKALMSDRNNRNWPSMLDQIKENYNQRPNRNLANLSPQEIAESGPSPKVRAKVAWATLGSRQAKRKLKPYKFSPGDIVRIQLNTAHAFSKGKEGYYSQVLYKVVGRSRKTFVNCYRLEEALSRKPVRGSFYSQELLKVSESLKKKLGRKHREIFAYRFSPEGREEVEIIGPNKRRIWIDYEDLLG